MKYQLLASELLVSLIDLMKAQCLLIQLESDSGFGPKIRNPPPLPSSFLPTLSRLQDFIYYCNKKLLSMARKEQTECMDD